MVVEGWVELPGGTDTLVSADEPFASRFLVDGLRGLAGRSLGPGRSTVCEMATRTGPPEPGPWSSRLRTFTVVAPAAPSCAIEAFDVRALGILALTVTEARGLSHAEGNQVAEFLAEHRDRISPLAPVAADHGAPTVEAVRDRLRACSWSMRPDGVRFADEVRGTVKVFDAGDHREREVPFDFSRADERYC